MACFAWAGVSFAQVDYATATLQGTIFDPQDRVITGAKVTAENEATGATKSVLASAEGYRIPALMPGSYRVETDAPGFAKSVAAHLVLTVGQLATYDMHLT